MATMNATVPMSESDARRILCVPETASFEQIKKSRNELIHIHHPDLAATDSTNQRRAIESMLQISRAWNVIQMRESSGLLGYPFNFSPERLIPISLLNFIGVNVKADKTKP